MPFLAEKSLPISNKDILSWIFDEPLYDQDKPIYINASNPSESISGNQGRKIIRQLAAGFHAAGVRPGDCVCLHGFNSIYYSMLFLGIVAAGGVFAGTNPAYTQFELTHHFKTSRAVFLIVEPELLSNVLPPAKECNIPRSNIMMFDTQNEAIPSGFVSWRSLLTHGERDWVRFDDERTSRTTTAARLYSSGTTGLPKAATLSHYNFVSQHTLVHEYHKPPYQPSRLLYLPFFHAAMVPNAHVTPLKAGHLSYVLRRFELQPVCEAISKYRTTEMVLVPPVAMAMLKFPGLRNYDLSCVKSITCGAGPLDKEHQNALLDIVGPEATFTQVWGMTETSCIATKFYYPEKDDTGSVGRPMPNRVRLIDDDGKDITAYDVPGELCVRGPIIITSYFGNPKATAESFDPEGYFKTGDVMYCDSKSKKWYIIDRKKELIKVRGFQVAPAEIEGVLLAHPHIQDAAVIGVQKKNDPEVELPRAYIARKPTPEGERLTEADVKSYCDQRLAKYKALTGGVRFVEAVPRNATGKALKRVLREMVKAEEGNEAKL